MVGFVAFYRVLGNAVLRVRCSLTLRAAAAHYDAELRAYLTGRRMVPLPEPGYSTLRGAQRRTREQLAAHAMIALVDISY